MRILLVNPPTPETIQNREYYLTPSLLYLAAAFRQAGMEASILDLNVSQRRYGDPATSVYDKIVLDRIDDFRPTLVGFGCLFSGYFPSILHMSEQIKAEHPELPVVLGGIHPTLFANAILTHCPSVDFVIQGEGEVSAVQLAEALKHKDQASMGKIDGLAFRNGERVVVNPKQQFIQQLDELPMPAYDLVDLADYYHDTSGWHNPKKLPINASIPLLSSRSCPRRCNFCSMFMVMGPCWRSRSPRNTVEEIEFLYNEYNHRHFSFIDDNLTLKKAHVLELCNLILQKGLDIQFETPNGIATWTLDEEVMDALVAAGLVRLSLAIESGSEFIRNRVMGKGLPTAKIHETVALTKRYKQLYTRAFFIIGMPEETRETLQATYDMIEEIDVDKPCVTNIMPFPGTRLFDQALKDDLFVDSFDLENIWKMDLFHYTGNRNFYVRPYNLPLEELVTFRERIDQMVASQTAAKMNERRAAASAVLCC